MRAVEAGDISPAGDPIEIEPAIEVGNIFKLGTRYSEPLGATYLDADGKERPIVMGSYGIGPARIVAAAIEQNADEKGIVWPRALAPVAGAPGLARQGRRRDRRGGGAPLRGARARPGSRRSSTIARPGAGEKLTDAELLGCPLRIVVGKRALAEGEVEAQERASGRRAPTRRSATRRAGPREILDAPRLRAAAEQRPKRRLFGIDRSGPPPSATRTGRPAAPWTIPNLVGYLRLAAIPVFLVLAFDSDDGRDTAPALLYFAITLGDYLDGFLARATGQYSRMGALLDPVVDRLTVLAGAAVCWHFELLPRWALAVLAVREVVTARSRAGGASPRRRHRDQLDRADRRLPRLRRDLLEHGLRLVDHPGRLRRRRRDLRARDLHVRTGGAVAAAGRA